MVHGRLVDAHVTQGAHIVERDARTHDHGGGGFGLFQVFLDIVEQEG